MLPIPYRVTRRVRETADTVTLAVAPAGPDAIRRHRPGQFNMLYLFGAGEIPISISGDAERGELVHTTRAVGAASRAFCRLEEGDALGVRGPFGTHWPVDQARDRDLVIIAGGIGLAPLRPVIDRVVNHRGEFGRVSVLIGARTPADLLYGSEHATWRARDIDVRVTVDAAPGSWRGRIGFVTQLIPTLRIDARAAAAMVCGPEIMMRFCARELRALGLAEERVYVTMERSMKCAIGLCGHCQFGPDFVCKDGPVYPYARVGPRMLIREL